MRLCFVKAVNCLMILHTWAYCLSPLPHAGSNSESRTIESVIYPVAIKLSRYFDQRAVSDAQELARLYFEGFGYRIERPELLISIIEQLYFEPHLFRTGHFIRKYAITQETLQGYFKLIQKSKMLQILFLQFSPHPHFFQILAREMETPEWIQQVADFQFVFPKKMELHMGHRCPADCIFCYSHTMRQDLSIKLGRKASGLPFYPDEIQGDHPMQLEEYKILIDEFGQNSPVSNPILVLSGGAEPFSFKHLDEVIAYASDKGIRVQLYTSGNGMNRSGDEEAFYTNLLKAEFIRISLNAATAKTYEHEMQLKTFDKVISNVERLVKEKINRNSKTRILANFVINRDNYFEMLDYCLLGLKLGLDDIYLRLPYVQTLDKITSAEKDSIDAKLSEIKNLKAEGLFSGLEIHMPERWIFDEWTPHDLKISKFDKRLALFSPTVNPYRHVAHRCIIANPGYFKTEHRLGTLDLLTKKKSVTLSAILKEFLERQDDSWDDIRFFDTNILSNEMILRMVHDELRMGTDLKQLPYCFSENTFEERYELPLLFSDIENVDNLCLKSH